MFGAAPCREAIFVADAALFCILPPAPHKNTGRQTSFERIRSERLRTQMDEKITSRENAKIKYACRLSSSAAFRRSEGRFLAEGRKLCPELARGAQLETLFSVSYTHLTLPTTPYV